MTANPLIWRHWVTADLFRAKRTLQRSPHFTSLNDEQLSGDLWYKIWCLRAEILVWAHVPFSKFGCLVHCIVKVSSRWQFSALNSRGQELPPYDLSEICLRRTCERWLHHLCAIFNILYTESFTVCTSYWPQWKFYLRSMFPRWGTASARLHIDLDWQRSR